MAAPAPADRAAAYRSKLNDFRVVKELGSGSWGTVLLVERLQDAGLYALKRISLQHRSHRDQLAAMTEAQVLSRLDSQYIVRYYDSFLHPEPGQDSAPVDLYIVMEYCEGGSLHSAIRASPRPLPEDLVWRVLLQAGLALHHMHSRRMLHRDVKSANILCSYNPLDPARPPRFKLSDVGVSKVLEEGKSHASTILGTPYYMSPEICQEKPYDAKSDIWALGVVLYECATRRHPFDALSQPSLILKILRGRYEPIVGYSADLTAIVARCLSQAAARRPSAERLLSLPAVRAKAAELGIELPPAVLQAGGGGSPGAPGLAPLQRPLRRQTCPDGGPEGGPAARRVTSTGERSRKAPLPAAAAPSRRQTVQVGAVQAAPSARRRGSPGAAAAGAPLADSLGAPQAVQLTPTGGAGAPQAAHSPQLEPRAEAAPSRRTTHFSVARFLRPRGGAAADASAAVRVQRSAKSESAAALPAPAPAQQGGGRKAAGGSPSPTAAALQPALRPRATDQAAAEEEEVVLACTMEQQAWQLRRRCLDLLGGDAALFEELHRFARVAAENEAGGGGGRGGGAGATMAALSSKLFARLDMARAAEALHLFIRLLAVEEG